MFNIWWQEIEILFILLIILSILALIFLVSSFIKGLDYLKEIRTQLNKTDYNIIFALFLSTIVLLIIIFYIITYIIKKW